MLQLVAWFLLIFFWGAAENRRIKDAWCVRGYNRTSFRKFVPQASIYLHTHTPCVHTIKITDGNPPPYPQAPTDPNSTPFQTQLRLADFLPFLREQFAYVGPGCVGGEREADPTAAADPFFQETPDTFRLWASGRRHVEVGGCRGVGCVIE